jgi:iron complex outermembrane receptor protein
VSLIGYAPESRELTLPSAGDGVTVEVVLHRTVLSLPGFQVTATPTGGDVRAVTQGTTQLSGKALEREMAGTIAQTLKFQPGIAVRSMGPAASAPIIRGLTGDRVLVLQDGQRTADLAGSADDHGVTIDPLAAQRVEVVRGPATLLYGNNALGGVVNVISGDLPTHVNPRSEWALSVQSESAHPGGSAALRASLPVAENWTISLRAGGRNTEDVRIPDDPVLGDRLDNTQSRSWNGSLGVGHVGDRLVAGAALKAYDFSYGLPVPPGSDPVSLAGRRYEATGRAEFTLSSGRFPSLRVDVTGQDYIHDELDGMGAVQQTFALDTRTVNLLLRQGRIGPFSEGAWGASGLFKQYAATGPAALTPAADSRGLGVFGFQEIALGNGGPALQVGGRFDDYGITSKDSPKFGAGRDRSFRALSGSIGLRVPLVEGISAGLNLARSFRAPTVEELFSGAPHAGTGSVEFGNPDLKAERGRSVEGVFQIRSGRWNGQFAAFHNAISDYVHLAARGDTVVGGATLPVFVYAQDDATLRGLEGQLEWAAREDLVIGATGDLLHAEQSDGTPLSFMPPARLGALLRWDNGTVSLSGDVHHEFRQDRVGAADELPTDAHTVFRAMAGIRWTRGNVVHSITLRGENLGNALHREATSRVKDFAPGPGRNLALLYRLYF